MLKVGIVGSGFGTYGLLPAFGKIKKCQVLCICAKDSERLRKYCKHYKVKTVYQNWREMLEKEQLDVLAIAVSPDAQYEIARVAIKKGLRVFFEKPLAKNYIQAEKIYSLARQKQITTGVDFIFPEIPEWQKAKQLIERKVLGKLIALEVDWRFLSYDLKHKLKTWKTDKHKGGGALAFYFSHVLYYLEFFLGEIKILVSSLSHSALSLSGGETGVRVSFKSKKGVYGLARLDSSTDSVSYHRITFSCEKGQIILENRKDVVRSFTLRQVKNKKIKIFKINKGYPKHLDERVMAVNRIAKRFIEACPNNKQILPSIKAGLRVQALIKQINDKAKKY